MTIQPGMIGVNTATDDAALLLVLDAYKGTLVVRKLEGETPYYMAEREFWPLITKLNTEG